MLGVDEENQGFSSYLYNHNNEKDHCVIGQQDVFKRIRIYVAIVLFLLPILLGLVIPSLIVIHYETVHERMMKKGSNRPFYAWAIIITSALFYCFTMGLAMYIISSGLQENTNIADVRWYYVLGLVVITALPVMNGITTIAAAVCYNMIPVMLSKNLLPSDTSPSLNSDKTQAVRLCYKIRFIAPTVGITSIVFTIQVMCPYSFYTVLGLFVSPIHTCSFLLFYAAGTACLVIFLAILLKAYYAKCKTFTLLLIGSSIFVLILVFIIALMEMMIVFGDHSNNGSVLSIIGSLAPSFVLSVLGYVGNWALSWLKKEPANNIPVSSLTTTVTWENTANWPRKRIINVTQCETPV